MTGQPQTTAQPQMTAQPHVVVIDNRDSFIYNLVDALSGHH